MIALSDLPELVADFEAGELDWAILYPTLLRLLGDHDVEEVMAAVSPALVTLFAESLREEFSDEELARTGLWIDNAWGEPVNRDQIVSRILRWIQSTR